MLRKLQENIERVFLGKSDVVRFCLTAFLAGEHLLLEDIPGVGKTLLAKALARSVHGQFRRIQFTPDLLPAEISGNSVYATGAWNGEKIEGKPFRFVPGPIFANIVLADEINRATPRTQSAMLEAMGERSVSCDGETHLLPSPFFVIATQNPMEYEGTFPLPESQLDRFLMRISIGYPAREWELQVLDSHRLAEPVDSLETVMTVEDVLQLQAKVHEIHVDESISQYILDIAEETRTRDESVVGISTRGVLSLYRAVQALALLDGRDYVIPDDVKELAVCTLAHRVILKNSLRRSTRTQNEAFIASVLDSVTAP